MEPLNVTPANVHKALTETQGDRAAAAKLLGWEHSKLQSYVHTTEELSALWNKPGLFSNHAGVPDMPTPPSDSDSLDRPPIDGPLLGVGSKILPSNVTPNDQILAQAMAVESYRLCRGLERIGLKEKEVGEAFGMSDFNGLHFKDSIGIISGGVTRLSVKYQSAVKTIIELRLPEILEGLKEAGSDQKQRAPWIAEEALLYKSLIGLGAECRKIMDAANRGALTQAIIRSKHTGANKHNIKRSKPTFNCAEPMDT